MVFAKPIAAKEIAGRRYAEGFVDYTYEPKETTRYEFITDNKAVYKEGKILVNLKNKTTGKVEAVELVPIGRRYYGRRGFSW